MSNGLHVKRLAKPLPIICYHHGCAYYFCGYYFPGKCFPGRLIAKTVWLAGQFSRWPLCNQNSPFTYFCGSFGLKYNFQSPTPKVSLSFPVKSLSFAFLFSDCSARPLDERIDQWLKPVPPCLLRRWVTVFVHTHRPFVERSDRLATLSLSY